MPGPPMVPIPTLLFDFFSSMREGQKEEPNQNTAPEPDHVPGPLPYRHDHNRGQAANEKKHTSECPVNQCPIPASHLQVVPVR